jgi:site-specific DNA-methyltransferase (adenine-specific)
MDKFFHNDNLDIYCGDCVSVMATLPPESVDLTVTSPPYDNLRRYNGFTFDFEVATKELYRVTKQGGVVVWVVGDATVNGSETGTSFKQALYFKEIGFNLHDTMIYQKLCYMPLTHKRYEQVFEYMFVLSKGTPVSFNPRMKLNSEFGKKITGAHRHNGSALEPIHGTGAAINRYGIDVNVWQYKTGWMHSYFDKMVAGHPATFPEQLANDHILSWSNPGDTVLDPMCGSGTTPKMALLNNRKAIGIDISDEYCALSTVRCLKSQQKQTKQEGSS